MSRHPRRVEAAVNRAAREASWLEPQDGGAVVVARALAEQLDELVSPRQGQLIEAGDLDATKVAYVAQTLTGILDRLGLTPRGRSELGVDVAAGADDELAEILRGNFGN